MKVAPDDPPLSEDPVFIPSCYKDPYDRLNRPFVVDYKGGNVGDHDENNDVSDWDNLDDSLNREDDDVMNEDTEINTEESELTSYKGTNSTFLDELVDGRWW